MNQDEIIKANRIHDYGSASELYDYIKPFLEKDDPYAFYFYSRFSLREWNESDEEFDKRSLDFLTRAAEDNVVEAMHQVSIFYLLGDTIEMDIERGKWFLDGAVDLGFGPAKLSAGLYFYYGANGYTKDVDKALTLISEAKKGGVDGADEELHKIMDEQAKNKNI
jgi:TPR repeat protein